MAKILITAVLSALQIKACGKNVPWEFGKINELSVDGSSLFSCSASILRYLGRAFPETNLLGSSVLERTEYLDSVLEPVTYLVGGAISAADFAVWENLYVSSSWQTQLEKGTAPPNVARYFNFLSAQPLFKEVTAKFPAAKPRASPEKKPAADSAMKKDVGKFVDLPGAEMGKVVVRFPPEASGYLHIGHAKAALINQFYQENFKGTLIMRFDDTNPAKENEEFTHTSDHFDKLLELCERMIREGKAYVDDTEPEQMKKEREERVLKRTFPCGKRWSKVPLQGRSAVCVLR
ncbi:SYEP-like protein [Mya arenaria]|uniref:SYEP-like protein n=1 Tax=Mya arenaria TaxID=6604 RepID=A0ABY7FG27_MYAAR|nr:SYEP-like protein [Mya arenaria]